MPRAAILPILLLAAAPAAAQDRGTACLHNLGAVIANARIETLGADGAVRATETFREVTVTRRACAAVDRGLAVRVTATFWHFNGAEAVACTRILPAPRPAAQEVTLRGTAFGAHCDP